ncbi:MAG: ribonucleotide reductase N-terminal alpha domain-containing protein [Nanoarchaeota archaeon]
MEKVYSYEESLLISTEYFGGDELAAKVFLDKYSLKNNNKEILESNPEQMHRRIAKDFARIEKNKFKNPFTEDEIFSELARLCKLEMDYVKRCNTKGVRISEAVKRCLTMKGVRELVSNEVKQKLDLDGFENYLRIKNRV